MASPRMKFAIALVLLTGWLVLVRGGEDDWHWTVGNWPSGNAWGEGCYFVAKDDPFTIEAPPTCEPNTEHYWDPELWKKYVEEKYRLMQEAEEEAAAEAEESEDGEAGSKSDKEKLRVVHF